MTLFLESTVEQVALAWFESLGYAVRFGPSIAPGDPEAERNDYGQVVLGGRLRQALAGLNPDVPAEALEEAFRRLTRSDGPTLVAHNRAIHQMIVNGVSAEYRRPDGSIVSIQVNVIDFDNPENDDWPSPSLRFWACPVFMDT
ncbi:MAG: hypothetical protein HPY52_14850 [Firmicutes bacterium]|nr:hypothetical protein [Bacillota bacterium]